MLVIPDPSLENLPFFFSWAVDFPPRAPLPEEMVNSPRQVFLNPSFFSDETLCRLLVIRIESPGDRPGSHTVFSPPSRDQLDNGSAFSRSPSLFLLSFPCWLPSPSPFALSSSFQKELT